MLFLKRIAKLKARGVFLFFLRLLVSIKLSTSRSVRIQADYNTLYLFYGC